MKTLLAMCLMVCLLATGCIADVPKPLKPHVPHKPHLDEKVAKIEVLDFYTTWCGPCALAKPTIDVLIAQGHKVRKIDGDKSPELVSKHRVTSYPTFIVTKRGKEVFRTHNVQELRRYLNQRLWHRNRQDREDRSPRVNPNNERPINYNIWSTPQPVYVGPNHGNGHHGNGHQPNNGHHAHNNPAPAPDHGGHQNHHGQPGPDQGHHNQHAQPAQPVAPDNSHAQPATPDHGHHGHH